MSKKLLIESFPRKFRRPILDIPAIVPNIHHTHSPRFNAPFAGSMPDDIGYITGYISDIALDKGYDDITVDNLINILLSSLNDLENYNTSVSNVSFSFPDYLKHEKYFKLMYPCFPIMIYRISDNNFYNEFISKFKVHLSDYYFPEYDPMDYKNPNIFKA